jgi:hypothetical protein
VLHVHIRGSSCGLCKRLVPSCGSEPRRARKHTQTAATVALAEVAASMTWIAATPPCNGGCPAGHRMLTPTFEMLPHAWVHELGPPGEGGALQRAHAVDGALQAEWVQEDTHLG